MTPNIEAHLPITPLFLAPSSFYFPPSISYLCPLYYFCWLSFPCSQAPATTFSNSIQPIPYSRYISQCHPQIT
ncbi:hypothetical protein SK128_015751 [Halocaridina rubra]|uniref:Uncharacterized protein n=1 Tax=Halocaridina rubra TaxID=373956 RepID=A0AAN9AF16_HALRR